MTALLNCTIRGVVMCGKTIRQEGIRAVLCPDQLEVIFSQKLKIENIGWKSKAEGHPVPRLHEESKTTANKRAAICKIVVLLFVFISEVRIFTR